MKIAFLTYLFLGFMAAYGNQEIPDKNDSRTTAEIMRDMKISIADLCDTACQSKFYRCYDKKKQSGFKCAADAVICQNRCKKR
ncbi:MAG: hypothetical protein E2O68_00795 [Deltaproteobacteria bacterium]|nr:MAG: hypothetical protein E2O68_00795 [Deltaproteobacteria bacterium]